MLTQRMVDRVKAPGRYADGHGLLLQVVSATNKSWLLRYERAGRERWMGLGPCHTVGLKQARERAREARLLLLDRVDPIEHRKAQHATTRAQEAKRRTFSEAAREFIAASEAAWSPNHAKQVAGSLRIYAAPIIGDMAVADVDTAAVLRVLEQPLGAKRGRPAGTLWAARTVTATRLRNVIEQILDAAKTRGYRGGGENPAAWAGLLEHTLPKPGNVATVEHHPALPWRELPALMARLRAGGSVVERALEFTLLVAARSGEVRGAVLSEIDFESGTWTIPASRMKAGQEHRVPLSARAVELLRALPREDGNPFVFIGARSGAGIHENALTRSMQRHAGPGFSVHGLRSSFRDWAGESSSFSHDVIEMSLAHTVGSKTERSYARSDLLEKRRLLLEAWSRFCASDPAERGTVLPLRVRT